MRTLVAGLIWLIAGQVSAEVVSIRSGQHDSFSRLVLSIPVGRDWTLGRVQKGYALELGDGEDSFDTSRVFDRITANRIAGLRDVDGRLMIELACDCHADAFLWRERLVIDIIDGAAPADAAFEAALDNNIMPVPAGRDLPTLPPIAQTVVRNQRPPLVPGTFAVAPRTDTRVAEAERAIVESLARAASQGVFDAPSRPVPILPDSLTDDGAVPPPRMPALTPVTDPMDGVPSSLPGPGDSDGPGLVLRTGIERRSDGVPGPADEAHHCISDELLSVDAWGDERDFSTQIAAHRRNLTGEFDTYPEGNIEALAKTYIYFGFGQEARQALALTQERTLERRVLDALSRVVDHAPQGSLVLDDQIDCNGFVVMWAALAKDSLQGSSDTGRDAAVMAFRLLPDQLRGHLGARLAQLFLDAGQPDTADLVLTAARRVESGATIGAALTGAELVETNRGPGPAIDVLGSIAEGNSRMTASGLVRLIDLLLAEGREVDDALLDLASAMRFEARQTQNARLLGLAEVKVRTARGDFAAAQEIVEDEDVPFTEANRDEQRSLIVMEMAARADTSAFLTFAFSVLPPDLSGEAENAVAARLLRVGFPERAMTVLEGPAVREAMAERRYLRAEAAAAMGDLVALNEALAGLTDPRAARIRAGALSATGDFQSALVEALQQPDGVADPSEAWRAGAWTLLEAGEDPLLQTASRAVLAVPSALPNPPTLAARRDLLDQSQATRAMTEELLGRFNIDDGPPDSR